MVEERPDAQRARRGRPRHETPSNDYIARLEEIITVATQVFRERGYEAGSLEDVASALGLRKASLYYYVESKSALLHLIFDRAISDALREISRIVSIDEPRQRLEALIRHQALRVSTEPSLFTVFFDQRPGLRDEHYEDILAKERAYVRHYIDAVQDAIAVEALPRGDPRMLADILLGMTSWSYKWFDPSRDDPEEFADACVRLVLGGTP